MISYHDNMAQETREHMRGGEGCAHLTRLFDSLPQHMRLFSIITLQRGESIGYHVHENETELFYFIQGTAEVQDDDQILRAQAGDAMATPSGHGHGVKNVGDDDLVLAAVIVKD